MEELQLTPDLRGSIENYESMVFIVSDKTTRENAMNVARQVKTMKSKIIDFFAESKASAYKTWKAITQNESTFTARLTEVEKKAKQAILLYDGEQDRIREAERKRLQIIEDERARKEQERLLRKAEKVKSPERQEALMEQASMVAPPTVQVEEKEKKSGEATRVTWKHKVVDPDIVPRIYMIPNDKVLASLAKATKGQMKIDGVEFYPDKQLAINL
jgi:hypothetical protein